MVVLSNVCAHVVGDKEGRVWCWLGRALIHLTFNQMGNQLIIHEARHAHNVARAGLGKGRCGSPSAASTRLCAFQGRAKCTLDLVFNPSQSSATNELNLREGERERQREKDRERARDIS